MQQTHNNTAPALFSPHTSVRLRNGEIIEVNELSWPNALEFFKKLSDQTKNLINEKGEIRIEPNKIMELVTNNVELANWLTQKSTGKSEDWINDRSLSEMLDVVTAALEVNLGVIASRLKNVKSRLTVLAAGEATPKLSPTSPASAT